MKNKSKTNRESGAVRKAQILQVFDTFWQFGQVSRLTMYEVAKLIKMSPSTHLTKILMEMVDAGVLGYEVVGHRANRDKRMFYLCDREFKYPLFERTDLPSSRHEIRINVGGKQV